MIKSCLAYMSGQKIETEALFLRRYLDILIFHFDACYCCLIDRMKSGVGVGDAFGRIR